MGDTGFLALGAEDDTDTGAEFNNRTVPVFPEEESARLDLHHNGFWFGKEFAAEVTALTADAGITGSAEWCAEITDKKAVHPDRAGFQRG